MVEEELPISREAEEIQHYEPNKGTTGSFWGPINWFRMLVTEMHWTFVFAVLMVYGVSQGLGGALARVGTEYYMKDVQKVQPSEAQVYSGITNIPWLVKPLWGLLTDVVPVFGYRRRPYFIFAAPPPRPQLEGEDKENADSIASLPDDKRELQKVLTIKNLVRCGFLKQGATLTPKKVVGPHKQRTGVASKKPAKIPFMRKEDKTAGASTSQFGGQAHLDATMYHSTHVTLNGDLQQQLSFHRSDKIRESAKASHQAEPSYKKGKRSEGQSFFPPPPPGHVGDTYAKLAHSHVAKADMYVWSKQSMEESNASMTRAAAELFFHQASRHKEMRALASSNRKLSSELASLKSKFEKAENDAKKLAGATDDLKRKLHDERSFRKKLESEHATKKRRLDSQVKDLSDRVTQLEREVKVASDALPTSIDEAENRGSLTS